MREYTFKKQNLTDCIGITDTAARWCRLRFRSLNDVVRGAASHCSNRTRPAEGSCNLSATPQSATAGDKTVSFTLTTTLTNTKKVWNNWNKYVRLRGRPYIHTCRSYVHAPRDLTNVASLAVFPVAITKILNRRNHKQKKTRTTTYRAQNHCQRRIRSHNV